jgi:hypothetical protein
MKTLQFRSNDPDQPLKTLEDWDEQDLFSQLFGCVIQRPRLVTRTQTFTKWTVRQLGDRLGGPTLHPLVNHPFPYSKCHVDLLQVWAMRNWSENLLKAGGCFHVLHVAGGSKSMRFSGKSDQVSLYGKRFFRGFPHRWGKKMASWISWAACKVGKPLEFPGEFSISRLQRCEAQGWCQVPSFPRLPWSARFTARLSLSCTWRVCLKVVDTCGYQTWQQFNYWEHDGKPDGIWGVS